MELISNRILIPAIVLDSFCGIEMFVLRMSGCCLRTSSRFVSLVMLRADVWQLFAVAAASAGSNLTCILPVLSYC